MRLTYYLLVLCWSASQAADTPAPLGARNTQVVTVNSSHAKPLKAVTSVGSAQAGYVHYFLITHPDDSLEYQVGIELEDQRIAWSFPEAGVMVSEFVKKGAITANGKPFKIEHLHGIRPFARDAEMRLLQKDLTQRVAQWVDNETPYCLLRQPGQAFCLSCGDFVVRILYPGTHPLIPALPRDFLRSVGAAYTTDDLLLYLVGLHDQPDKHAMLAKLATLDIPVVMREDLLAMIQGSTPDVPATSVAAAPRTSPAIPGTPAAQRAAKPATAARIAARRTQAKKL